MVSTQDEGDDSLSCLYGLRVLSTCLVVLQHVFIEIVGRSSYNKEKILKVITKLCLYIWSLIHSTYYLVHRLVLHLLFTPAHSDYHTYSSTQLFE